MSDCSICDGSGYVQLVKGAADDECPMCTGDGIKEFVKVVAQQIVDHQQEIGLLEETIKRVANVVETDAAVYRDGDPTKLHPVDRGYALACEHVDRALSNKGETP